MTSIEGKVALVTGAASGIGKENAFELSRAGSRSRLKPLLQGRHRRDCRCQAFLRFGCNIVPVQFFAPQRQPQIFFIRGVWASSRVMP